MTEQRWMLIIIVERILLALCRKVNNFQGEREKRMREKYLEDVMIKKMGVILIVIALLANIIYADTLIYTYDAATDDTTLVINGNEVDPNVPDRTSLNDNWKATIVQMGENGWSVTCEDSGSGCWDTIKETNEKWHLLYF